MEEKRKKKKFLNQEYAMMRYKEGATDREISEETGVTVYTVYQFRNGFVNLASIIRPVRVTENLAVCVTRMTRC